MIRIITSLIFSLIVAYSVAQNTAVNFGTNTSLKYQQTTPTEKTISVLYNKASETATPKATFMGSGQCFTITPTAEAYENSLNLMLNIDQVITENDNLFWLSKARFNEITVGKTMFYINGPQHMFGLVTQGKEPIQFKVNGTMITTEAYHLKSVGNGPLLELWVLNNVKNPVVVKASGSINLHLSEITY